MSAKSCCFTGHRYIPGLEQQVMRYKLYNLVESLILEEGVEIFYNGGALGFDMMAAFTVISLKKQYPNIKLYMVLPCRNQDKNWSAQSRKSYKQILSQADKTYYTSEDYEHGCMHRRNRFMVDNSDYCVAYYNGGSGGTAYTVKYAKNRGVEIFYI